VRQQAKAEATSGGRPAGSQIDEQGYRANVGIILANSAGLLFWARRVGTDAWQFPQGGIRPIETLENAMYRELHEEVGLLPDHVEIMACTQDWLRYRLPRRYMRTRMRPVCIGQKQRWFLLRLLADDSEVRLDVSRRPEFDHWRWVDYWHPLDEVIDFKRPVYKQALDEFLNVFEAGTGTSQRA
jgi:putative (di)nucleoside polyphosphate hydrolase